MLQIISYVLIFMLTQHSAYVTKSTDNGNICNVETCRVCVNAFNAIQIQQVICRVITIIIIIIQCIHSIDNKISK